MAYPKKQNRYNRGDKVQSKVAKDIDALAEYEDFCNRILPKLRKLLSDDKKGVEDIMTFAEKDLVARVVSIALGDPDNKVALTAIKDLLDRSRGKAKETVNVTTRYESMSDEELDALLSSKKEEAEDAADIH